MSNDLYRDLFRNAAEDWVCDSYSIDIRYFAGMNGNQLHLRNALIILNPLPFSQDMSFRFEVDRFYAGQCQLSNQPKQKLLKILEPATQGQVHVYGYSFSLSSEQPYRLYSEMVDYDRWFSDLHLKVVSSQMFAQTALDVVSIDNALRQSDLPFDGLADIAGWLGLNDPRYTNNDSSIDIRVGPPVDLIFSECTLENNQLSLTLHAHPCFDVGRVGLAVRAVPGKALESRRQIGVAINWEKDTDGKRVGVVRVHLEQADSVLVMLMIGSSTVRRQWFLDPIKARNSRLIAIQTFDRELRMVKQAVLESSDSDRFEKGVSALLFLLGFTSVLQVETDSPDIVATTPSGRLILVECTTRIADFSTKLGKLVDRRGTLSKDLQASNHHSRVDAVLVCALPKDQIAARTDELKTHKIILVTKDDLAAAFDRLRFPSNPDEMIDTAIAQLAQVGNVFGV